jgi:hypothetical protein
MLTFELVAAFLELKSLCANRDIATMTTKSGMPIPRPYPSKSEDLLVFMILVARAAGRFGPLVGRI